MLDVKQAIKHLSIDRHIKVGELAKRLGMSQQALSNWLCRSEVPKINKAEEVLSVFGCHLAIVDDETGEILF